MKYIAILLVFYSLNLLASDAKIPCLKSDGSVGLNGLEEFDCFLVAKAVNDDQIKKSHQDKIHEKLAEKLAFKIERNMEEMALLDQYFNQYDLNLTKTTEVKNECRLETIANPCKTGNSKKLEALLAKLPSGGNNLFEKLRSKFFKTRGVEEVTVGSCPIVKPSGYHILNAQFDNAAAETLISSFKKKGSGKEKFYKTYPQLKIIENSSPEFKAKFESYVAQFPDNEIPKNYLVSFFKKDENQSHLSKGLADTCKDLKNNIKQFLCEDLSHLAVTEDSANELFIDDQNVEENIEISNAFSCAYKNRESELLDKKTNQKGIDTWLYNFSSNVVKPLPKTSKLVDNQISGFCDLYLCKSDIAKSTESCKNGGPIASEELKVKFGCNVTKGLNEESSSATCSWNEQKYISYIESLEKRKKEKEIFSNSSALATNETAQGSAQKSKPRYSEFFENFVGVEGTIIAEGRKTNPINIAEKVREFEERKIEVIPQANKDIILANNEGNKVYNVLKAQKQEEALQQQSQANQQAIQSFTAFKDYGEDEKKAVIAQSLAKFSKSKSEEQSSKDKDEFQNLKERARTDEIKRMRSELESVMKGMGGSEEEKLATVATHNDSLAAAPKAAPDSAKNLGSDERERLESYRKSLQNWEGRIREREFDLNDRDFRSPRTAASDEANPADKRYESPNANQQQQNGNDGSAAGGANAQGIKLSKAGGTQNSSVASEANGEAGAKSQVDGEAIVTVEALAKLEKANLKMLGIGLRDSFIIKVRHNERLYDVPVKSFTHDGKSMFVPLLNNQNRELAKIILESPLFAEYRQYQIQRNQSEI